MADAAGQQPERLVDFLRRVSGDLSALATWYGAGNEALLKKYGQRLSADHHELLRKSNNIKDISAAIQAELGAGGGAPGGGDVSAHQLPHVGPCWVLLE